MKIRHLGIAVDSIEERLPIWESFGLKLHHTEEVDSEGVTTAHLKVGGYEIELLEPMGKDTPVGKFIDKKGPGIHHLALEVDDINESLSHFFQFFNHLTVSASAFRRPSNNQ